MPPDITAAPGALAAERLAFETHGFFKLERAFDPADAARMEDEWWDELADKWDVVRAEPSTWRQPMGDMKRPKQARSERLFETDRLRTALDEVLGEGQWDWPRNWGRAVITMPSGRPASAWAPPKRLWHWDGRLAWNSELPQAAFVFTFVGAVGRGGGGTLVVAGSPRLVLRQYARLTPAELARGASWQRDAFGRLDPWLKALTGQGKGPDDRVAAFMGETHEVEGVALRVVELTGEPGDAYVCDPLLVHCVAPNCNERPRMMRIQMVYNRASRRAIKAAAARAQQRGDRRREARG